MLSVIMSLLSLEYILPRGDNLSPRCRRGLRVGGTAYLDKARCNLNKQTNTHMPHYYQHAIFYFILLVPRLDRFDPIVLLFHHISLICQHLFQIFR